MVDRWDFPLEIQEGGRSTSHGTMNSASSTFGLKLDSLLLPDSGRRELVGGSRMPHCELDHILNGHGKRRVLVGQPSKR